VQSAPIRDPGEDKRSRPCGDESRQERPPDLLRRDLPTCCRHLEQEKGRDQRPPEERGDRSECARQDEKLRTGLLQPNELHRKRAEREPKCDQWRLGAEYESESQRRERGGEDAGERDREDRVCTETLQRRVPAVTREPDGGGHEQPGEPRHKNDVPPGRLAPAELVWDHVPHEVGGVMDRGLEQHRGERDWHAEQRREHERPHVGHRLRVAHGWTLLRA
jgi:hypothetical protein